MAMPGLEGLLEYAKTLPERLREQFLAGMRTFAETRQPPDLWGALNPLSPLIQDAAQQAGGFIAPQVNALSQSVSQGSENLGFGPLSIPDVTDEDLAPFLMLGMGGRGGMGGRNKMGFYSPSGKALTTAPGKGQSGQYLAHLKKEPGAIREAKETGLLQALEEAPGTLTKEEVVSMWNPIELDETVKADDSYRAGLLAEVMDKRQATGVRLRDRVMELTGLSLPQSVMQHSVSDWEQELRSYTIFAENLPGDPQIMGLLSDLGRYDDQSENLASVAKTKYGNSQDLNLPGGSNAKEILVQLPTAESQYEKRLAEIAEKHGVSVRAGGGYASYATPKEIQELESLSDKAIGESENFQVHTGGHWDEPNVLAHIRTNERDVGGVKALHIEEIQSDWHQAGQKKGYWSDPVDEENLRAWYARTIGGQTTPWEELSDLERTNKTQEYVDHYRVHERVPDAPYKKDWHELAFKRALMEGINDPSIERLTWTTGDVQKERYNLAKYINSIEAQAVGDNFNLAVTHKDGHAQNLQNVTPDELADHVGKEMAEKIVAGAEPPTKYYLSPIGAPVNPNARVDAGAGFSSRESALQSLKKVGLADDYEVREAPGRPTVQTYSGLDLEVGGEYHKQLYDKKITKFAKKFLKKYGVEPERIQGKEYWEIFDIQTGKFVNFFDTEEEAKRHVEWVNEATPGYLKDYRSRIKDNEDLWSIDITPEMRQDLQQKGVPLTMTDKKPLLAYA